jgi:hypothetical protein
MLYLLFFHEFLKRFYRQLSKIGVNQCGLESDTKGGKKETYLLHSFILIGPDAPNSNDPKSERGHSGAS